MRITFYNNNQDAIRQCLLIFRMAQENDIDNNIFLDCTFTFNFEIKLFSLILQLPSFDILLFTFFNRSSDIMTKVKIRIVTIRWLVSLCHGQNLYEFRKAWPFSSHLRSCFFENTPTVSLSCKRATTMLLPSLRRELITLARYL